MTPRLSVIIPVRNDAAALRRTLDYLCGLPGFGAVEVIVAASGDREGTDRAVSGRARLLWPGGSTRAALMNAGAAMARGPVLLFLHADSFPPVDAFELISQALSDTRAVGGAFEHLFAEPGWSLQAITWINRIRYRLTRNYYGDQGIFVRAGAFRQLGGYIVWLLLLYTFRFDTERYAESWRGPADRPPGHPWPEGPWHPTAR
jgi:glycosyltransferase involved in cell wall biosynthesis